jgi:putative transposase
VKLEIVLKLCKLTKYEYYKKLGKRKKAGRKPTCVTSQINGHGDLVEVTEESVIDVIINTLLLPETSYGYRVMTAALQHEGFIVNHKKVYRLMYKCQLLGDRHKRVARSYVKYRQVNPKRPLEVLEMDRSGGPH